MAEGHSPKSSDGHTRPSLQLASSMENNCIALTDNSSATSEHILPAFECDQTIGVDDGSAPAPPNATNVSEPEDIIADTLLNENIAKLSSNPAAKIDESQIASDTMILPKVRNNGDGDDDGIIVMSEPDDALNASLDEEDHRGGVTNTTIPSKVGVMDNNFGNNSVDTSNPDDPLIWRKNEDEKEVEVDAMIQTKELDAKGDTVRIVSKSNDDEKEIITDSKVPLKEDGVVDMSKQESPSASSTNVNPRQVLIKIESFSSNEDEMKITTDRVIPQKDDVMAVSTIDDISILSKRGDEKNIANDVTNLQNSDGKSEHSSTPLPNGDEHQRLTRRKRRRQIERMLKHGQTPSFIALISPDEDNNSQDDLKPIVIDVDEYLGLKEIVVKPDTALSHASKDFLPVQKPDLITSSGPVPLPADEGWYEGVITMALPNDGRYLNAVHTLVRENLEFFSATLADTEMSQAGRRIPIALGQVGIRCIHCANALNSVTGLESDKIPNSTTGKLPRTSTSKLYPPGSISYPNNIAGVYQVCTQKPALHFETCPNLPFDTKAQLYNFTHDSDGNPTKRRKGDGETRSISAVNYYAIAAKRIGLVNTMAGIRFGRDVKLDPLSVESVRAQVEDEAISQRQIDLNSGSMQQGPLPVAPTTPRITADENSERVLAASLTEQHDQKIHLAKSEDRNMVSDFIFLCLKQMAICHAVPSDFNSRGKKTKMMRVGFSGFCCIHCSHIESTAYMSNTDFSCRSFASASDNLASSISNSFYLHLQKCFLLPVHVKKAIGAYKRLHSRQMNSLPYGSQRRMFQLIWDRLRAADKTEAEMEETIEKLASTATPASKNGPKLDEGTQMSQVHRNAAETPMPDKIQSIMSSQPPVLPHIVLPACSDAETNAILKAAEADDDPGSNDHLLLSSDRHLITDFVYLSMRQLKVAHPNAIDFNRGRRSTALNSGQAGLCCKHCLDKEGIGIASGRSFPSQADNMASSLNTSLFQHMQKCCYVQSDLKRALANLKKLHSIQVSALRFGSQRRFFNLVWERLSEVDVEEIDFSNIVQNGAMRPASVMQEPPIPDEIVDGDVLANFGFIASHPDCIICQKCRMVPMSLRASGSFAFKRTTKECLERHKEICKEDTFDLGSAADALESIAQSCASFQLEMAKSIAFKAIIRELVGGNEDLVRVFTEGVVGIAGAKKNKTPGAVAVIDSKGLWCQFRQGDLAKLQEKFGELAKTIQVSPILNENTCFIRYFQIVSPSLVVLPSEIELPAEL